MPDENTQMMAEEFTEKEEVALNEQRQADFEVDTEVPAESVQEGQTETKQERDQPADGEKDGDGKTEKEEILPVTLEDHQALQEKHKNLEAALEDERNQRKNIRQEQFDQDKLIERMEDRFSQMQEKLQPKDTQTAPDFDEKPAEHLKYNQEQIQKRLGEADAERQQSQEQAQYQQHVQQVQNEMGARENVFAKENADYYEAVQYMRESRDRDFQAMGIDNPAEREAMIGNDALNVVQAALQRGINPAEVIYNMAKNAGYQKADAEQAKQQANDGQKLETVKKNIDSATTLGPKGSTQQGDLTLRQVANMSEQEFDDLTDDQWASLWS